MCLLENLAHHILLGSYVWHDWAQALMLQAINILHQKRVWPHDTGFFLAQILQTDCECLDAPVHVHMHVVTVHEFEYTCLMCCICARSLLYCIINVWQCVKRHHMIMRLYSYISGSQVVLESTFDTGQAANVVGATLEVWWVQIYIKYKC